MCSTLALTLSSQGSLRAPSVTLPSVCSAVTACKVVAQRDVDGDGRTDTIARVTHADGHVTLRVLTAAGSVATKTLDASQWYGEPWHGAAPLDGQAGVELVVGYLVGAHTEFLKVVTWRAGRLVIERAPGGSSTWIVDAAYSDSIGVWRHPVAARVYVTVRTALDYPRRNGHYHGRDVRFAWSEHRWNKVSIRRRHYDTMSAAEHIGGWHVGHLARF
jgi:hypothetical protein